MPNLVEFDYYRMKMADILLVEYNTNKSLGRLLGFVGLVNILLLVFQTIAIWTEMSERYLSFIVMANSIIVSLLVCISGYIFRRSLHQYYSGNFIMRVDWK